MSAETYGSLLFDRMLAFRVYLSVVFLSLLKLLQIPML